MVSFSTVEDTFYSQLLSIMIPRLCLVVMDSQITVVGLFLCHETTSALACHIYPLCARNSFSMLIS